MMDVPKDSTEAASSLSSILSLLSDFPWSVNYTNGDSEINLTHNNAGPVYPSFIEDLGIPEVVTLRLGHLCQVRSDKTMA